MASTSGSQQNSVPFGLMQLLTLAMLMIVGAVMAAVMSRVLPWKLPHLVAVGLWWVELLVYLYVSYRIARHLLFTLVGFALAWVVRTIEGLLMALILHISAGSLFQANGQMWPVQVAIILVVIVALVVPLSAVLKMGLNKRSPKGRSKPAATGGKSQQFMFTARPKDAPMMSFNSLGAKSAEQDKDRLMPPANFTVVYPREDVVGMVNLPVQVILDSVPDARPVLKPDCVVRVRLAFLVPQLKRATCWLLWQQLFSDGNNEACLIDTNGMSAQFRDYWVRIPAKYYAMQVPQEHFATVKAPPSWLKQQEVPQEKDLVFEE